MAILSQWTGHHPRRDLLTQVESGLGQRRGGQLEHPGEIGLIGLAHRGVLVGPVVLLVGQAEATLADVGDLVVGVPGVRADVDPDESTGTVTLLVGHGAHDVRGRGDRTDAAQVLDQR